MYLAFLVGHIPEVSFVDRFYYMYLAFVVSYSRSVLCRQVPLNVSCIRSLSYSRSVLYRQVPLYVSVFLVGHIPKAHHSPVFHFDIHYNILSVNFQDTFRIISDIC